MKRLALLRHAQAEAKGAGGDRARRLSPRGRQDMAGMAARIARLGPDWDLALVSPAARTLETWSLAGQPVVPTTVVEAIYDASLDTLVTVLASLDGAVRRPVLVGHNPGIEELAEWLLADRDRGRVPKGFPAAGLALIDLPDMAWSALREGAGTLVDVLVPQPDPDPQF